MRLHALCFALLSVTAMVIAAPAQATGLTRTFVSSSGVDSNPCTITQPCASFAVAYNAVAANGIIAALDPGKYGPVTITMPVTINGNGWAAITGAAKGNGITVNVSSELSNVVLSGLEVDGAGAAYNGIVFEQGASLTISNCIVKDFIQDTNNDAATGNGILIAPISGNTNLAIVNTVAVNNANSGIHYFPPSGNPTVSGTLDHVVASNNNNSGIYVQLNLATGGSAGLSISNSVASNNEDGISTRGGSVAPTVTIDNDEISNNEIGVSVSSGGIVLLSRSVITQNILYGVDNGSTVYTFQNNQIYANGNNGSDNIAGATAVPQQ
jgi:hypothetical protein